MPKHIHKYVRKKFGSKGFIIYRCILPGCTHFISADLIIGRESICNKCDKPFIITINLALARPHCIDCTKGRKSDISILSSLHKILTEG